MEISFHSLSDLLGAIRNRSIQNRIQATLFDEDGNLLSSDDHILQLSGTDCNLFQDTLFSGMQNYFLQTDLGITLDFECIETSFMGYSSYFDFSISRLSEANKTVFALVIHDLGNQYHKLLQMRQERNYAELHREKLETAQAQLNRALEEEKAIRRKLEFTQGQLVNSEKMASLGQLTAGIAHEINNPINFVLSGIDALEIVTDELFALLAEVKQPTITEKMHGLSEELNTLVKSIKNGASRTTEIIRGLQLFSHFKEGEQKPTDLHENLDATLILLRSKVREGLSIRKDYSPLIREVCCNPGRLNQVFMNILSNAIQAIPESIDGLIDLSTYIEEKYVCVKIKDNGTGMSNEVMDRILEPFYTTKEIGSGTGLGLSISYGIIQEHGGQLVINSQEGKGSEFIVKLPTQ